MSGVVLSRRAALAMLAGPALLAIPSIAGAQEQPLAPEVNPLGDIPDSQVFVTYTSPVGFSIKVPEGWARTERADGAHFADRYGSIDISVAPAASAPTVERIGKAEAAAMEKSERAARISAVRRVWLPAGPAVLIVYTSNSEPNAVTDKQIRLENNRYLLYRAGKEATLSLSAPAGADNADQWQLMARSFRWN